MWLVAILSAQILINSQGLQNDIIENNVLSI